MTNCDRSRVAAVEPPSGDERSRDALYRPQRASSNPSARAQNRSASPAQSRNDPGTASAPPSRRGTEVDRGRLEPANFAANVKCDDPAVSALRRLGFGVALVWECDVEQRPALVLKTLGRLAAR